MPETCPTCNASVATGARFCGACGANLAAAAPPPRVDPWRRVSGMHKVRKARGLAVVRELWHARDDIARSRDIAPGRILQDVAIVNAALADPPPLTRETLTATAGFKGRGAARHLQIGRASCRERV